MLYIVGMGKERMISCHIFNSGVKTDSCGDVQKMAFGVQLDLDGGRGKERADLMALVLGSSPWCVALLCHLAFAGRGLLGLLTEGDYHKTSFPDPSLRVPHSLTEAMEGYREGRERKGWEGEGRGVMAGKGRTGERKGG